MKSPQLFSRLAARLPRQPSSKEKTSSGTLSLQAGGAARQGARAPMCSAKGSAGCSGAFRHSGGARRRHEAHPGCKSRDRSVRAPEESGKNADRPRRARSDSRRKGLPRENPHHPAMPPPFAHRGRNSLPRGKALPRPSRGRASEDPPRAGARIPGGSGDGSRSSTRSSICAFWLRAESQATSAQNRFPRCILPLGLGANRPRAVCFCSITAFPLSLISILKRGEGIVKMPEKTHKSKKICKIAGMP